MPYRWDIIAAPLAEVANQEALLPPTSFCTSVYRGPVTARRRPRSLRVSEGNSRIFDTGKRHFFLFAQFVLIARTFRICRSVVNRVLNSPDKPK
jgi:hypothetical protein